MPESSRYELWFSLITFGRVTQPITMTSGRRRRRRTATGLDRGSHRHRPPHIAQPCRGANPAAPDWHCRRGVRGAVTAAQLETRPLSRPGEVLETVPGLVISQHSGEGKANQSTCADSIWITEPTLP